ncbi:nSTAND1 domain-containing NTPase [Streptomyces naganishii]|uniref:HTH cro/C1-type domain-containing protein n=1 Tax=Streptomyces naganishii JCM 4654 TaxID=1306179 RepID=A0A919CWY6_9ACTN|nr:helix-turn-helix domain-containing protein [Streptomyces naganishii]GHD93012.1 hypothetical protein GCM10010508_48130 [Streptomyces naganishii JCM 4654]
MGDLLGEPQQEAGTGHGHEAEAAAPATPPFPRQLRRLRQQRGLSLAELARRTHYSKGYLSKIETGAKRATADVARRCDEVLDAGGELLRLAGEAHQARGGDDVPGAACPYRGLSAFTTRDADRFFGREQALAALVEHLFSRVGEGPLMVVAPSGAGKSSLINAGLVPALRRPGGFPMAGADRWPVVGLTPTARPLDELAEHTAKALGTDPRLTGQEVADRPDALLRAVRAHSGGDRGDRGTPPPARLVLLVDQFEELFTLCSDETERRVYARVLCALAAPPASTAYDSAVVLLGVRADFSGRFLELPELAPVFADGLHVLPAMTTAELCACVTRPAELAGLALEPGLLPLLLRDAGVTGEPGAERVRAGVLPLVSHALMATWREREKSVLTVAGYERTGGIQGAVARTAEDAFARLHPAEQKTVRRILSRLVHLADSADGTGVTRRRVGRDALAARPADADGAARALDAFVRARLITVDSDTVEITHEALLHSWPRLREWIRSDRAALLNRQQLAHAAAEWEREGRDPSALYRGARLEAVGSLTGDEDSRIGPLDPTEEAFLHASRREELARRRQARRQVRSRQALVALLVVLLGCALAAGALAFRQRGRALAQEHTARAQALALQSTLLAAGRPEASMLLAGAAYRAAPTATARGALLSIQAQPFVARLGGHSGAVNAVAFAPGKRLLATGSSDGTVRVRRLSDRRTIATLAVTGRVRSIAFGPQGDTVAATDSEGVVRLWSWGAARRAVTVLPADTRGARAVAFAPRGRTLAVAAGAVIDLWDTAGQPRLLARLTGHTGRVDALAYAPDGRTLASGGTDRTVRLWDTGRTRPLAVLRGHTGEVLGLAFAPDGRGLASGSVDRTVRLWDVGERRTTATLTGHSDDVNAVTYTPDGTTVISASGDGTTRLWDVRKGRLLATLAGHTDYVMSAAVDPTGALLATGGFDHSVVLWDLRGRLLAARPFTEVSRIAYRPDGRVLAAADADHAVGLWDLARRTRGAVLTGHPESVTAVAWAPDGATLASAGSDGAVRLWDVAARRTLATLTGHRGAAFAVAFAPDGRTLASAGADGTVRLWDAAAGRPLAVLTGHTDFVNDVAFSPDGRTLAGAGDDLTVRLWDVRTHRRPATLSGHTGAVRGVAFSPDGRTLASCGNDGTVRLWDVARRRLDASLTGHTGSVRALAFSPDGRLLASGGSDRTVRLWDVPGRRPWATLTGHTNAVSGVAFAPDGRTVASAGNDGTVRLWDLDTGARLAEIGWLCRGIDPGTRRELLLGTSLSGAAACAGP